MRATASSASSTDRPPRSAPPLTHPPRPGTCPGVGPRRVARCHGCSSPPGPGCALSSGVRDSRGVLGQVSGRAQPWGAQPHQRCTTRQGCSASPGARPGSRVSCRTRGATPPGLLGAAIRDLAGGATPPGVLPCLGRATPCRGCATKMGAGEPVACTCAGDRLSCAHFCRQCRRIPPETRRMPTARPRLPHPPRAPPPVPRRAPTARSSLPRPPVHPRSRCPRCERVLAAGETVGHSRGMTSAAHRVEATSPVASAVLPAGAMPSMRMSMMHMQMMRMLQRQPSL